MSNQVTGHSSSTPLQLYSSLSAELDPVLTKKPRDGKWFKITRENKLSLYSRPDGFFAKLLELISRLIWGHKALENKFNSIGVKLVNYLNKETDGTRKTEFLGKYTPIINEIIRSGVRLANAGKINLAPQLVMSRAEAQRVAELIYCPDTTGHTIWEPSSGKMVPPYYGNTTILVENPRNVPAKLIDSSATWENISLESPHQMKMCDDFTHEKERTLRTLVEQ